MLKKITSFSVIVALAAALAACGGGGGADSSAGTPAGGSSNGGSGSGSASVSLGTSISSASYSGVEGELYLQANQLRQSDGWGTFKQDVALDTSAGLHAQYLINNFTVNDQLVGVTGDAAHIEVAGQPGYVGAYPDQRNVKAGYQGVSLGEIEVNGPTLVGYDTDAVIAQKFIAGWLMSPGHRAGLLDPSTTEAGIGVKAEANSYISSTNGLEWRYQVAVMEMGHSATVTLPSGWMHTYPSDGAVAPGLVDTHGNAFAPSITIAPGRYFTAQSWTMTDASGAAVAGSQASYGLSNWAFFQPAGTTLTAGTTYTVTFSGTDDTGSTYTKIWSFTTPAS